MTPRGHDANWQVILLLHLMPTLLSLDDVIIIPICCIMLLNEKRTLHQEGKSRCECRIYKQASNSTSPVHHLVSQRYNDRTVLKMRMELILARGISKRL